MRQFFLSLRSRRKHKAWGVSPGLASIQCEPMKWAAAFAAILFFAAMFLSPALRA
jgi:hypothetical protein